MESKENIEDRVKIEIDFFRRVLGCNFSLSNIQDEVSKIHNFDNECGIRYTNQELLFYCYKVIDKRKWLLSKIKYGF